MTRSQNERFEDILAAIGRCQTYAPYLRDGPHQAMAYDAVLRNLAVIGEAVRALPPQARAAMPDTPWASIAGLRNIVIHEYFRVDADLVIDIIDNQLADLAQRLGETHGA